MSAQKPIRVFCTWLSDQPEFYATQHYKERRDANGRVIGFEVTGKKYDVTQDIARAVVDYGIDFHQEIDDPEARS